MKALGKNKATFLTGLGRGFPSSPEDFIPLHSLSLWRESISTGEGWSHVLKGHFLLGVYMGRQETKLTNSWQSYEARALYLSFIRCCYFLPNKPVCLFLWLQFQKSPVSCWTSWQVLCIWGISGGHTVCKRTWAGDIGFKKRSAQDLAKPVHCFCQNH